MLDLMLDRTSKFARRLLIGGRVQGAEYRPFVCRLAHGLSLKGRVRNVSGQVQIHVGGQRRGGYHLMCDARRNDAVARPRDRERRVAKPLAALFPADGYALVQAVRPASCQFGACAAGPGCATEAEHGTVQRGAHRRRVPESAAHRTSQGTALLDNAGFQVRLPMLVPVNDAGVCLGQVMEFLYSGLRTMNEDRILLAHGNGGRFMRELITEVFAKHLANPALDTDADAVLLPGLSGEIMVTTDGFTVQPLEFPGGNLGSLAVHGVVNDLAVAGAEPRYFTLSAIIEEGLEVAVLERLIASFACAAKENGVQVAAGDTKVVRRGEGGGLYVSVAGIGVRAARQPLHLKQISPGDRVLVSGPVGDHGISVMLAREQFGLSGEVQSDSASVLPLARAVWNLSGVKFLRDPTRGGLATVAHEIAHATACTVVLEQKRIPVRDAVASVCEMLGYDPYYLACEGRIVVVAAPEAAESVLSAWHALPGGEDAALIGRINAGRAQVVLETELGGRRVLDELEDDPLPRIC